VFVMLVSPERAPLREGLFAEFAHKWAGASVDVQMCLEVAAVRKPLPTSFAVVGFFSCVHPLVHLELVGPGKAHSAGGALVVFLAGVGELVFLKVTLASKGLAAEATLEGSFTSVGQLVAIEVPDFGEGHAADVAAVGFFSRMHALVNGEVAGRHKPLLASIAAVWLSGRRDTRARCGPHGLNRRLQRRPNPFMFISVGLLVGFHRAQITNRNITPLSLQNAKTLCCVPFTIFSAGVLVDSRRGQKTNGKVMNVGISAFRSEKVRWRGRSCPHTIFPTILHRSTIDETGSASSGPRADKEWSREKNQCHLVQGDRLLEVTRRAKKPSLARSTRKPRTTGGPQPTLLSVADFDPLGPERVRCFSESRHKTGVHNFLDGPVALQSASSKILWRTGPPGCGPDERQPAY